MVIVWNTDRHNRIAYIAVRLCVPRVPLAAKAITSGVHIADIVIDGEHLVSWMVRAGRVTPFTQTSCLKVARIFR